MDIAQINALAGVMTAHGLSALEIVEGDVRIRLEKSVPSPQPEARPAYNASLPAVASENGRAEDVSINFNNLFEVKSPLVGVFYAAASPDSEPYTHIGSKVKKGDVLCLIEAMKLMNEITAEHDGEIADVCLKDGDIAEFGQVLFKIL